MMDALLYAVRDAIRGADFGYSESTCEIMDDELPPPRCGKVFVSVHQGSSKSIMQNSLDEYMGFLLTLTMRVTIPPDRAGTQLIARDMARKIGWNARARQLGTFLHMNWGVLQDANQKLVDLNPDAKTVYGFCEPAIWRDQEKPYFVGGEWFGASPDAKDVGIAGTLTFEDCRRLQAIGTYT